MNLNPDSKDLVGGVTYPLKRTQIGPLGRTWYLNEITFATLLGGKYVRLLHAPPKHPQTYLASEVSFRSLRYHTNLRPYYCIRENNSEADPLWYAMR